MPDSDVQDELLTVEDGVIESVAVPLTHPVGRLDGVALTEVEPDWVRLKEPEAQAEDVREGQEVPDAVELGFTVGVDARDAEPLTHAVGLVDAEMHGVDVLDCERLCVTDTHPEDVTDGDGEVDCVVLLLWVAVPDSDVQEELLTVEDGVIESVAVPLTHPVGVLEGVALTEVELDWERLEDPEVKAELDEQEEAELVGLELIGSVADALREPEGHAEAVADAETLAL